jgi:4a-hydroxytetrahydrobiopterin dehydratase
MPAKMTCPEVGNALVALPGWAADGDAIVRTFTFADHIAAMGFVTKVAMAAEVADHHPELTLLYNTVRIKLWSHDSGGVTQRDIKLAARINTYE